ncbi:putative membrane protein [Wickerhamomyces ciferrii]|uniref:Membrane protein n=1 Tax=Wickerhamomyces ciferrii (strain ATCC 14091 / BCRC 22168 / CBS 111 / JCM 3599 / NBRC 0793 / NRRL Y-1031 F-60-10) TaxID=1206466 RepID=K0KHC8_WICCF|nr:uncharacterized protein BN7_1956 [Wickerhamomyces ciferrii]CCH42411.1 putative membrane protein [Wickerhamomyces ciferrii]
MSGSNRPFLNNDLPNDHDDDSFEIGRDDLDQSHTNFGFLRSGRPSTSSSHLNLKYLLDSPKKVTNSVMYFYNEKLIPNIGLLFIILSQFFNSIMVVATKLLETDPEFTEPIHPFQILFVRMIITFAGCYAYLKYIKKDVEIFGPREVRWLLVLRGIVGFFGVFSMYYSLMYLTVSDAVVITFLVPSVTGFLAWAILRERWTLVEALGGLVSLFGVLLIARPTFLFGERSSSGNDNLETSNPEERLVATMVALVGVCGASGVYIVIRKIGKSVHSLVTVEYFAALCVIISLGGIIIVPGLSFRIPHTSRQWFLFFALGISGFCMQFLLTEGIQREKASRASAMLYTQMLYAIIWEVIIWHHFPNIWSWLGIIIILGSAFAVIYYKPKEIKIDDNENNYSVLSNHDDSSLDQSPVIRRTRSNTSGISLDDYDENDRNH